MGWANEHLHRFRIRDEIYGDSQLLDDGFEDQYEFIESTGIKINDVVPKALWPLLNCFRSILSNSSYP